MAERKISEKSLANLKRSNQESNAITRESLEISLLQLLDKKDLKKITISELVERAGVSRAAFYRNYESKEELLESIFQSTVSKITKSLEGYNFKTDLYQIWVYLFKEAKKEAEDLIDRETKLSIQGYDLDTSALDAARGNLSLAGLEGNIHFQQRDMRDISSAKKYGFIITNPPYGERLEEKEAMPQLYREMGKAFQKLDEWSYYIITGFEDAPKYFGRKPDKNRKIYNGMMKTYFYSYQGAKPKRQRASQ